jgi:hypothetical protein
MKIQGFHFKDGCFYKSDNTFCPTSQDNVITWLLSNPRGQINIACHLDYFTANLLKQAPEDKLRELNDKAETKLGDITVRYVPQKFLSLVTKGKFFLMSDANQYDYWSFNKDKDYSGLEASQIAQKTGEHIYQALVDLRLSPTNLISPIRAWEKEHETNLPKVDDIPALATEISYQCCQGNWLEVFKKGHFPKIYDYDMRSCFASVAANLMDTRYGEWIENSKYQPEAVYGECEGTVTIFPGFSFSPIFFKNHRDTYSTSGTWDTSLTKTKIDYINRNKAGFFVIKRGVWWRPKKEVFPLREPIYALYKQKENSTGYKREVAKRVLNGGFYGKFIQLNQDKEFGQQFNSVWASEIESQSAVKVAETCLRNKVQPISIAVDGIITDKKIFDRDLKRLGDWKLSEECAALVISSGIVALQEHKTLKDFSLDYDWLMSQIRENPDNAKYTRKKWSPVTLAKACNENRLKDIGNLEEIVQTINIPYESKRAYAEIPQNGGELIKKVYRSYSVDVSMIRKLNE